MDVWELLGLGGDAGPLLALVWVAPVIILVLYGQRIQLIVTSGEIKKGIARLQRYGDESRAELESHARVVAPGYDRERMDRLLDYFTIMPVDLDPAGIVGKIRHTVRSREDYTRRHIEQMMPGITRLELGRVRTLLEISSSLGMLHRAVNHMYLTAKKQKNYPLILPLQMLMPSVLEQAEAMREGIPAFRAGQPVGDGIGPMVVGRMMLGCAKEDISPETVLARTALDGRNILLVKARGPESTVGRPADALAALAGEELHAIIMVDAALKLEGEESASVAQGFGAAMGGTGAERFQMEEIAEKRGIPVFSIIVRQSIREASALMSREIAGRADGIRGRIRGIISENTEEGQTVLVVGVGNTSGVAQ